MSSAHQQQLSSDKHRNMVVDSSSSSADSVLPIDVGLILRVIAFLSALLLIVKWRRVVLEHFGNQERRLEIVHTSVRPNGATVASFGGGGGSPGAGGSRGPMNQNGMQPGGMRTLSPANTSPGANAPGYTYQPRERQRPLVLNYRPGVGGINLTNGRDVGGNAGGTGPSSGGTGTSSSRAGSATEDPLLQ